MGKEPRFTWRWHKERLPVVVAMVICIIMMVIFVACADNTRNFFFVWLALAADIVLLVCVTVVLPRVMRKEKVREKE